MTHEASIGEHTLVAILRGVVPDRVVEIGDEIGRAHV